MEENVNGRVTYESHHVKKKDGVEKSYGADVIDVEEEEMKLIGYDCEQKEREDDECWHEEFALLKRITVVVVVVTARHLSILDINVRVRHDGTTEEDTFKEREQHSEDHVQCIDTDCVPQRAK